MPIKIPRNLPAFEILQNEGVMVMSEREAVRQDIRPLKIALLNLMPMKIETETQFARLIGSTPLQIELTLVSMSNHFSKNTPAVHMESFYKAFSIISKEKFESDSQAFKLHIVNIYSSQLGTYNGQKFTVKNTEVKKKPTILFLRLLVNFFNLNLFNWIWNFTQIRFYCFPSIWIYFFCFLVCNFRNNNYIFTRLPICWCCNFMFCSSLHRVNCS